jgi:hypothetical protein
MTVKPTPEELMGYADGQLDAEHTRRVEHALAAHPELRAIVEDHQRTRAAARDALNAMAAAPLSPGLARLAKTLKAPRAASRPRALAAFAWPAAAAACLAVGLATGTLVAAGGAGLIRWQDGPSAGTQLARVLERSPSGEAGGEAGRIVVVASFEAADGRYCRQFEIASAADGVACRGESDWNILAFARRPGAAGSYQAASGADPVAVAVAGLNPGPRIEAEAERVLIGNGWKD